MKKMYKNEKGITLVALVITIIVLIILAAVSINSVMNDGLIENAKDAAGKYENAQKEEKTELGKLMQEIENQKGSWVQEEDGTITNKNVSTKSFTVGEKVTLDAEGVPDVEWLVYGVNANNRLELVTIEPVEITVYASDIVRNQTLKEDSEIEEAIDSKVKYSLEFTSDNNSLRALRYEDLEYLLNHPEFADLMVYVDYVCSVKCTGESGPAPMFFTLWKGNTGGWVETIDKFLPSKPGWDYSGTENATQGFHTVLTLSAEDSLKVMK